MRPFVVTRAWTKSHRRADPQGQRDPRPKLSKLQGFKGYYMIESGNGVFSSLGLFENPEQIEESTKVASSWVRDEKLETAFPNPPKITSGKIVAQSNGVAVA